MTLFPGDLELDVVCLIGPAPFAGGVFALDADPEVEGSGAC